MPTSYCLIVDSKDRHMTVGGKSSICGRRVVEIGSLAKYARRKGCRSCERVHAAVVPNDIRAKVVM